MLPLYLAARYPIHDARFACHPKPETALTRTRVGTVRLFTCSNRNERHHLRDNTLRLYVLLLHRARKNSYDIHHGSSQQPFQQPHGTLQHVLKYNLRVRGGASDYIRCSFKRTLLVSGRDSKTREKMKLLF